MSNINYNQKEKYRLTSAYSIENRTTSSSHFNRTQRLVKELKNFRSSSRRSRNYSTTTSTSFYKTKPSFDNFHYQTLRDNIHNNEKYSNLFVSTYSTLYSLKKRPPSSIKHTLVKPYTQKIKPFHLSITTHSNTQTLKDKSKTPKIKIKVEKIYGGSRNHRSTTEDTLTQVDTINYGAHSESIRDFVNKTQTITRLNYCKNLNKLNYEKRLGKAQNEIDLINIDLYNYQKTERLLTSFVQTYKNYNKHLEKILSDNTKINYELKSKKNHLLNEIHVLKTKLKKYQVILEDDIKNKYFLMCVKNNSSDHEHFSLQDKAEYEKDQQCLLKLSTLGQYLNYKKKLLKKTTINSRNLLTNTLSMAVKRKQAPYIIFSSVEDFKTHLENISYSIAKLLMQYNKNQNEIIELKKEIAELQKPNNIDLYFTNEIKSAEEKLLSLKAAYKQLNDHHHNISSHSLYLHHIPSKIIKLYNILNAEFNMEQHRKISYNIGLIDYMQDIERGVNELMNIQSQYKQNQSCEYNVIQKRIERGHKINFLKISKEQGDKIYQAKIQKIIEHNNTTIHLKQKRKIFHYKLNTLTLNKTTKHKKLHNSNDSFNEEINFYFGNDK